MPDPQPEFPAATVDNFEQLVLDASRERPVLVDFWATWCAPCKALEPVLQKLSADLAGQLTVVKVNADEQAGLTTMFAIRGLPTLLLFSGGQPVGQLVGAQPESNIHTFIGPYIVTMAQRLVREALECRGQGQLAEAERLLVEALDLEPDNSDAIRALLPLRAVAGRVAEARDLHSRLLRTDRESSWGVALATLIELAEIAADAPDDDILRTKLAERPDDSGTRAALAARYVVGGENRQAMDELLELMRRDRSYSDELGRRALLAVFELEDEHSPLANDYRRKLAAALH